MVEERFESRKMSDFLIRAAQYTLSVLEEIKANPIKDDDIAFGFVIQELLKVDLDVAVKNVQWLKTTLENFATDFFSSAKIPAIVEKNQELVNICIDCYVTNLEKARAILNKRTTATIPMPSLDDEMELVKKVKEKYYKK